MTRARMPVLFVAHGNPMNALGRTRFARFLAQWGPALPRPRAVLVISAHWERPSLRVTAAPQPETIHDFYGFPQELFAVRYPAPGDPGLAARVAELLAGAGLAVGAEPARGLDHGAWSPLRLLFPDADVPVVELSLLTGDDFTRHVAVGRPLAPLRDEGVLIVASGNLVHNLAAADLRREDAPAAAWSTAFDAWVKERLEAWDVDALAAFRLAGPHGGMAHPTSEHFTPLLVACGAADPRPAVGFPYEGFEHGTLSLRCVRMD